MVALQRTARAPRAAGHDDEERGEQTAAALATAAARAEASIGGVRSRGQWHEERGRSPEVVGSSKSSDARCLPAPVEGALL